MKLLWKCLFSPRLYKVYKEGPQDALYEAQGMEKWGDKVITMANTILNITLYTSPFMCMYIYKRDFFTIDETRLIGRVFSSIGCILAFSFILRAYGRSTNPKYVKFLQALSSSMNDKKVYLSGIRQFDFEFHAWPTTFSMKSSGRAPWFEQNPFNTTANSELPGYQRVIIQVLAYVVTHTFGLRLIYPGSMAILQSMLWGPLFQGRTHLVEDFDGQRSKLLTSDGNHIDTMFVDMRNQSLPSQGKILVICCEGNSGFYEFGIMTTPVKAGYSALGWNHPGFAESTGLPYPSQEHNAIDAVMQYAIEDLGFDPEQIVMFGWSIGGYSAAWAAVNYPVRGLVMDATFDDLLPLAENQMPSSWSLLVKEVVRSYVNLHIANLVTKYDGAIRLVRRTEDEIICLRQGQLSTNRGNYLLIKIIEHRHPEIMEKPFAKENLLRLVALQDPQRADYNSALVPLISKYMRDLGSSHCTPLPEDHFVSIMDSIETENN
ncbi:unnamed protein product [Arctia plantaginis]|uniref:AB hydrolase-1 domain-containing protein n=1 Tax=Arctia plantaginis TaxID=874455 RepID=A0A8S0Z7M8_ARCPL|nr:unnamed protein product [Arctia plantaginis]